MATTAGEAPRILVVNAGSSSLKFAVYRTVRGGDFRTEVRGQVAGIGVAPRLTARDGGGVVLADAPLDAATLRDARAALDALWAWLRKRLGVARLAGIGHRVVHGGARFRGPTRVTPEVLQALEDFIPLAPLHQPCNLHAIRAALERLPGVPQVACFDTSFHREQPPVAQLVPLPEHIRRRGVQRYGFHGLSYEYVAAALPSIAPEAASGRVVVAHLGSGASLCALRGGRSVDSTLGFTALDGLCMGTRPGALDPGVVLYLLQGLGMSVAEVEDVLYRQSGLLGLSGMSSDMRHLLGSELPAAKMAVDYFVYRAVREIGGMAAVLGGLDALVFTAGIGENSAEIRRRICESCAWLGLELDANANRRAMPRITRPDSPVSAWIVPTNEELMIARHTAALLGLTDT